MISRNKTGFRTGRSGYFDISRPDTGNKEFVFRPIIQYMYIVFFHPFDAKKF